ncbi:MAG: hypothetical protein LBH04_05380 [Tannerellaceae bacterium]|jgi:hypothetical protein|nr:hypothetical protein [Tannerellaceae bacterium]
MKNNTHLQAIPAQTLQELQTKLKEVYALLTPYAVPLTPAERHDLLKMGTKTLEFVEKAHEFALQNPSLRPPYLDMTAFDADFVDAHGLWSIQSLSEQVNELLSDTAMAAGSDAYHESLLFYSSVKVAALQDVPGAKAIYEELNKCMPIGKRKPSSGGGGIG